MYREIGDERRRDDWRWKGTARNVIIGVKIADSELVSPLGVRFPLTVICPFLASSPDFFLHFLHGRISYGK